MNINKYIITISCNLLVFTATITADQHVRLHGSLKEIGSGKVKMDFFGASGDITDNRSVAISVASDGSFDFSMPLKQPTYYIIERNILYLSPGDDMHVDLKDDNRKSSFSGKGSEANSYLKGRLFPKRGSFLDAGKSIRKDFASTRSIIDSLAVMRFAELQQLQGVSDEFKEMETIRIKADIVNSYLSYVPYGGLRLDPDITREDFDEKVNGFYAEISDNVNPLLKEISASDRYLELQVVRTVLLLCYNFPVFEFNKSERLVELVEIMNKIKLLSRDLKPENYKPLNVFTKNLKNNDFREAFSALLKNKFKMLPGSLAIDLELSTPTDASKKLSDFKGEVLYLDFWATWCAPCLAESPHYEALSKEYPGIRFIAISKDKNGKAWKSKIGNRNHGKVIEVLCQDPKLESEWNIMEIPRFVLIDKNFNIISTNAPRPSQREEIVPLLEKLKKDSIQ